MKTFTPAEIRERIDELRKDCMVMRFTSADIADALEYLLQFVEWKPIEAAPKDREILISDGFDGYALAEWNEKYQNFSDSSSIYPEAHSYCELIPPPSTDKEGDAS